MPGPSLPTTGITSSVTTGHITHTYAIHSLVNQFDTTLSPTAGQVPVGDGTVFDNRALLSTDIPTITANTQSGTAYTLVLGDAGKLVEISNASANALTVPPNSSIAFPVGTAIVIRQYGVGTTTITAGAGVTLRSRGAVFALAGQYGEASITKRATDEWVVSGDLA